MRKMTNEEMEEADAMANGWIAKKPLKPIFQKNKTIICKKGKVSQKISAVSPKCPTGYKVAK